MTVFYKYIRRVNSREEEELLKLKVSVGTRANGCLLATNRFRQEM